IALIGLGAVALGQGGAKLAEAKRLFGEGLAIFRAIGQRGQMAICLWELGEVVTRQGEPEEAEQSYRAALEIAREIGFAGGIVINLSGLGMTACGRGDFQTARHCLHEALQTIMKGRLFRLAPMTLLYWATLLARASPSSQDKQEQAVELLAVILRHP